MYVTLTNPPAPQLPQQALREPVPCPPPPLPGQTECEEQQARLPVHQCLPLTPCAELNGPVGVPATLNVSAQQLYCLFIDPDVPLNSTSPPNVVLLQ